MTIKAWSHKRAEDWKKCPYRCKLLYVDRLPEPSRPLKEGQTEAPSDRGNRIHDAAERYVKGGVELLPELATFQPEFDKLRELYAAGRCSLEGEWAHDEEWAPVAWRSDTAWLRVKIDALVFLEPSWLVVIDYKSGRRSGNEIKHAGQVQLYTVSALMRYPQVEKVTTELWYVDEDDLARQEYTREQGLRFFRQWNQTGVEITTATEFKPRANKFSCQFCLFSPERGGNGACPYGV